MLKGGLVLIWELDMNLEPTLLLRWVSFRRSDIALLIQSLQWNKSDMWIGRPKNCPQIGYSLWIAPTYLL